MQTKTIVHIIGAASSKCYCLSELQKKIGGAALIFSYDKLLNLKKAELEVHCLHWIRHKVQDKNLILTCGLPYKSSKAWIKKAYPGVKFRHFIWEVNHEEKSENDIANERSWSLFMDGLLTQGKKAFHIGIPSDHDLIKYTPLSLAIEYAKNNKDDITSFMKSVANQQAEENYVHEEHALICPEAFSSSRKHSINKISQLVTSA